MVHKGRKLAFIDETGNKRSEEESMKRRLGDVLRRNDGERISPEDIILEEKDVRAIYGEPYVEVYAAEKALRKVEEDYQLKDGILANNFWPLIVAVEKESIPIRIAHVQILIDNSSYLSPGLNRRERKVIRRISKEIISEEKTT